MSAGPRITLRIGRITGATEGLSRTALERALRAEIARVVAQEGTAAFGPGRAQARVQTAEPSAGDIRGETAGNSGAMGARGAEGRLAGLAAAAVKAVRS